MTITDNAEPEIVLDLSRLLSRVLHQTPTGIDRCEMAYAQGLRATVPDRLGFAAVHPTGLYGRLPYDAVCRFLDATALRWAHGAAASTWERRRRAASELAALRPRRVPLGTKSRIYLQPSPNNLTRPQFVQAILRRERARFVCLVHDLIPLQYPEYARPDGAALHARRIDTIVRLAAGIVTNSHATLAALRPYLERAHRSPATAVAHLGTHIHPDVCVASLSQPYFVTIGTIEPRKNHLLLLNLWRRMAEEQGAAAIPKLVVIGRRGWENEQVVDMLERCPALVGCVEELGSLPDAEMQSLLAGARALLLPSFAEGYGMPVTEAIMLGVPVVCSDLPALREAGGDIPWFLDPLDGHGWAAAIRELLHDRSGEVSAQAKRRTGWAAASWSKHIAIVLDLLHRVAS